jgi:uncharacterized membrane protein
MDEIRTLVGGLVVMLPLVGALSVASYLLSCLPRQQPPSAGASA